MVKYLPVHVCLGAYLHSPWFKCKLDTQLDLFTKNVENNDSFGPKKNPKHQSWTCANPIFNQKKV